MKKFTFSGLFAGSALLLSGCRSASLGIIGGADGPTAVFVTSSPNYTLPALAVGALLLIGIVLLIKKR